MKKISNATYCTLKRELPNVERLLSRVVITDKEKNTLRNIKLIRKKL